MIVLPLDLPPSTRIEQHQRATPRYMTAVEFEARLDLGIPAKDLARFRRTRIASFEDFPDYLNFLRSLGSVVFRDGRFERT